MDNNNGKNDEPQGCLGSVAYLIGEFTGIILGLILLIVVIFLFALAFRFVDRFVFP